MKINNINITLTLFGGENKIFNWVSEDRTRGKLTLYTSHSIKSKEGYVNLSVPLIIWGVPDVLERMEAKIHSKLAEKGQSQNGGNLPISIFVQGGRIGGYLKKMRNDNGVEFDSTMTQIDLNLSPYASIGIDMEIESIYSQTTPDNASKGFAKPNYEDKVETTKQFGESKTVTNDKDINLEEIKF